jgi:hypothetical protein
MSFKFLNKIFVDVLLTELDVDVNDYDLQWVRSLTVPMHLGLIDRPLCPII